MPQPLGNLPMFSKIKLGEIYGAPIVWEIRAKDHPDPGYPANSVGVVTYECIKVGCFDAWEANNPQDPNSNPPTGQGLSNWELSNARQWLNKAGPGWYAPTHANDRPPRQGWVSFFPYEDEPGFLSCFTGRELACVLPATILYKPHNGALAGVTDRFFFLSVTELGGAATLGEGVKWAGFTDNASRQALLSAAAAAAQAQPNPVYRWTRSNNGGANSNQATIVNPAGAVSTSVCLHVNDGWGVFYVACCLDSSMLVSDTTDPSGCYTLATPPAITGEDGDLGVFSETFSISLPAYQVTDLDEGDTVTVEERLDGTLLRPAFDAEQGVDITPTIPPEQYVEVLNGPHALTIKATDSGGASVTRTYTFTKEVTIIEVRTTECLDADDMPTVMRLSLQSKFPNACILQVRVCNNGYDEEPTWEDATQRYLSNQGIAFTNTEKTASKWGIRLWLKIDRAGAAGPCYLSAAEGTFK